MRVGIIGTGLIGNKRAVSLHQRAQLVGFFDVDSQKSASLASSFGTNAFESVESLCIEVGDGGLIIVATPNQHLVPTAKIALANGCHVLLEKPGAISAAELKEVTDLASMKGLVVRVGYNHRFHPAIKALVAAVSSGNYGEVLLARARYGHGGRIGYENEWRASKAQSGGGELLDQGCHLFDLVNHISGNFRVTYSDLPTLFWPMEVEDNAFVAGKLANGGSVWLHTSWTEWKNIFSLEITCRSAKFEVRGLGGSYGPETFIAYTMPPEMGPPVISSIEYPPGDTSWVDEIEDILNEIKLGSGDGCTGQEAVFVLEEIERAYSNDY